METLKIIFAALMGLSWGISSGIGIWPIFKQPKNIQIQVVLFCIGILFLGGFIATFID